MRELISWSLFTSMAFAASLLAVTVASLLPEKNVEIWAIAELWWNVSHVLAFALLTGLAILASAQYCKITASLLVKIAVVVLLFGSLLEALQPITGRTASIIDLASDFLGVVLSIGLYGAVCRYRRVVQQRRPAC
jgi:VanZ family protein